MKKTDDKITQIGQQLKQLDYNKDIRPCFQISKDKFNMYLAKHREIYPSMEYRELLKETRKFIDKHYREAEQQLKRCQIELETMTYHPIQMRYCQKTYKISSRARIQAEGQRQGVFKRSSHSVIKWVDSIIDALLRDSRLVD